ncbi:MAG: C39 family peptidase [Leptospiraceae bacterium]|nr:C39 family peptidase [Leptospiraceae bacterium]
MAVPNQKKTGLGKNWKDINYSKINPKSEDISQMKGLADIIKPPTWQEKRFKIESKHLKILNCIWNSQRDNKHTPNSSCNVTSMQTAISMDYNITDDEMWELCYSPQVWRRLERIYGKNSPSIKWLESMKSKRALNEVHSVLTEMLNEVVGDGFIKKIDSLNHDLMKREIDYGYPVVIAGKYTHTGHFVCVVGYDDKRKSWIVNDSWGDWTTSYRNRIGDNVLYPYNTFSYGSFISKTAFLIHSDRRIPIK